MQSLGTKIRLLRENRGWSQDVLGARMAMTGSAISFWEADKHKPSLAKLRVLADLIGAELLDTADLPADPMIGAGRAILFEAVTLKASTDVTVANGDSVETTVRTVGRPFAMKVAVAHEPLFARGDLVIVDTGREGEPLDFVVYVPRNRSAAIGRRCEIQGDAKILGAVVELRRTLLR